MGSDGRLRASDHCLPENHHGCERCPATRAAVGAVRVNQQQVPGPGACRCRLLESSQRSTRRREDRTDNRHHQRLEAPDRTSGKGPASGLRPRGVWPQRAHGAQAPDETWETGLPQAEPDRRISVGQHVNRGLDQFMLRGEIGAMAEWSLFSATHNLLKRWRSGRRPDRHAVSDTIAR